jgi:hypothetical protein
VTTEERREQLRQILNRHDDMARAFTRTADDVEAVQDSLEGIGRTIRDATHAIREATAAMLAANRAALALFNDTGDEH